MSHQPASKATPAARRKFLIDLLDLQRDRAIRHQDPVADRELFQQGLIGAGHGQFGMRRAGLAFANELLRPLRLATGDGNQPPVARIENGLPVLAGDVGRPEDSPAADRRRHVGLT